MPSLQSFLLCAFSVLSMATESSAQAQGAIYSLQIDAPRSPVHNTYLRLSNSTTAASTAQADSLGSATKFTPLPGQDASTYELYSTASSGASAADQPLALMSQRPGFYKLALVQNAAGCEWKKWTLAEGTTAQEGKTLGFKGLKGRWIAMPKAGPRSLSAPTKGGEWEYFLYDDQAGGALVATYIPVTIKVVSTET